MYNLPDEEFDRLCREAAEHPEAQVPARGWDRMRQRLDREMPDDKGRRRAWPFWIPFLLFLPISLFVWKNQSGEPLQTSLGSLMTQESPARTKAGADGEQPAKSTTAASENEQSSTPAATSGSEQSATSTTTASGNEQSGTSMTSAPGSTQKPSDRNADQTAVQADPSQPAPSASSASQPKAVNQPKATFSRVRQRAFQQSSSRLLPGATISGRKPAGASQIAVTDRSVTKKDDTQSLPMKHRETDGAVGTQAASPVLSQGVTADNALSDGLKNGSSPAPQAAAPGAAAQGANAPEAGPAKADASGKPTVAKAKKASPAKPVPTAERGLGFSLVVGPDWSNVRFSEPDKTGFNAGITIQYRFNKRLVLQTGLLYSQKHYTVADAAYPGYNPTNPAFKMIKVQANCFMWDIPLNLRYDVIAKPRHKAYALVGVSSYLMSKEDLHYYFKWNNNPRYKGWVNEVDKMYNLSEFNFAIGYEQALTREWSVKLEPFIKLPISSVGTGKVDLTSLGALAGITYTPLRLFKPTPKK